MKDQPTPASFDEFPYPSHAYSQTHPDHLATLAILSGMSPRPVDNCRVLELGCASGGNLIPIAYSLPDSEFLGVDFSGRAIEVGQNVVRNLGVTNVTLQQADILDLGDGLGQFDYLIVYGIFSWVPPQVQEKILAVCRRNLAPQGVAYFSYNVYPGWGLFGTIRDLMLYHTRHVGDQHRRIAMAREMLQFMAEKIPVEGTLYGSFLRRMQAMLEGSEDGYLRHDFLAEVNDPLYFHQFLERARRHDLQYLANAETAAAGTLPDEVIETILALTDDFLEVEQYLDFMRNRTFRETLLCHKEIPLSRKLDPDVVTRLRVTSAVQPVTGDLRIDSTARVEYKASNDTRLSTAHPLTKAALVALADAWPQAMPFETLLNEAKSRLTEATGTALEGAVMASYARALADNLLQAYSQSVDLVRLHTHQPSFVMEAGERPLASATARYQAEQRIPITNLYHQRIDVNETARRLLIACDGSHDESDLLEVALDLARQGIIEVSQNDRPIDDDQRLRPILQEVLEQQLRQFCRVAVMLA